MPDRSTPAHTVRSAVSAAAARRRRRESSFRLWRVAPAAAAAVLAVVAVVRLAGAPIGAALALVLAVVIGLAAYGLARRRERAISDAVVAGIDADAGYGGELRSAWWFASHADIVRPERVPAVDGSGAEWVEFHVGRAAERVRQADWRELYPAVRAARSRLATAGLLGAAIALAVGLPARSGARAGVDAQEGAIPTAVASDFQLEMLPPDILKQIEELLAEAERGNATTATRDKAIELSAMFTALASDLNEEKLKELAEAMDPSERGLIQEAANTLAQLADRTVKAADVEDMPADIQQALRDLGMELARAAEAEQRAADEASRMASTGAESGPATTESAEGPSSLDQASIQTAKDSDPAAGAGLMMLAPQLASGGTPSSGVGGSGNSGPMTSGPVIDAADLAEALRHELVEASADAAGENVLSETRRQTERGQATVGFTGTATRASEQGRASAPPPIPENRRATVQTYFTRQP